MPLMSEHIDDALDRLANGADANQRLTLESILRTGLNYMSDEQIARTRTLCSATFFARDAQPAYLTGMHQMRPGQHGAPNGVNGQDSLGRNAALSPRTPQPGDTGYDS